MATSNQTTRTIAAQWVNFSLAILPADASQVQRTEMRKAFYAGAAAMLGECGAIADLSDDAGVAVLEGLHQEVLLFTAEMVAGGA